MVETLLFMEVKTKSRKPGSKKSNRLYLSARLEKQQQIQITTEKCLSL